MSLRSISVDETPDLESKPVSNDLQPVSEATDSSSETYQVLLISV